MMRTHPNRPLPHWFSAFAAVLAALGVIDKLVSGFGGGGSLRWSVVGWGMVPQGEVKIPIVSLVFVLARGWFKGPARVLFSQHVPDRLESNGDRSAEVA